MPELAEVEYYRHQWSRGLRRKIVAVESNPGSRVFRGAPSKSPADALAGATLLTSEIHGKQMLFRFSKNLWMGVHLGMTGSLRFERKDYPGVRHDHLILRQARGTMVFNDPRQFGRVRFDCCTDKPEWWLRLPPALNSEAFTWEHMNAFLDRHSKLALKAALLHQGGFPGIGNWMADEILWRSGLRPARRVAKTFVKERRELWDALHFVARGAIKHISPNFDDPPKAWFYHRRWKAGGRCPKHDTVLSRETVGGRTTAWCPMCQK